MYTILYDNTAFLNQRYGGISRFFSDLIYSHQMYGPENIKAIPMGLFNLCEYNKNLLLGPRINISSSVSRVKLIRLIDKVYEYLQFFTLSPSLIHRTYYSPRRFSNKTPELLSVFDFTHERFPKLSNNSSENIHLKKEALELADYISCISHSTANDLIEFYNIGDDKVSVNPLGLPLEFEYAGSNIPSPKKEKTILFVGARSKYKNFKNFVISLSLIGKYHPEWTISIFGSPPTSEEKSLCSKYIGLKINWLSDQTVSLIEVYRSSSVFVFPSFYEGFGLPILEAQSQNCIICCSDIAVFREIGNPKFFYFEPSSPDDMSQAINTAINSSNCSSHVPIPIPEYYKMTNVMSNYSSLYNKILS